MSLTQTNIIPILLYRINYWCDCYSNTNDISDFYRFYEVLTIYQTITKNSVAYGWNDSEFYIKILTDNNKTCESCNHSVELPNLERYRWLNPDRLVFCKKIYQSVVKTEKCNSYS
jgi:hypothetical protein